MKTFSFFYAAGTSGYVRGEQIADYIGAKKNPTEGYENDICIYVKLIPKKITKHMYLDVDDAPRAAEWLKKHPEVGVIVVSSLARDYLMDYLRRTDIIVIPHAHCNYEQVLRPEKEVENVGIIGSKTSFQAPLDDFRKELKKIGLNLLYDYNYWDIFQNNRKKVCDFYKSIDVQVAWRPKMYATPFKNPNKLVNAGSFRIPTVAYPEFGFSEWRGNYVEADTIQKMLANIELLKTNNEFYHDMSNKALRRSNAYHIEYISKLYQNLC
jgi:DNA-dependent RNA polymerase auxiliary subunit epsilon